MMSKYRYSAETNEFFPYALEINYRAAGHWPDAGVDFDENAFMEWKIENAPEGKMRIAGEGGMPAWQDTPPLSSEELIALAEADKSAKMANANAYMNDKQWPGKAAIGRLKGADLDQYNLWLDYLDALEGVSTASAPDINWPESPAL